MFRFRSLLPCFLRALLIALLLGPVGNQSASADVIPLFAAPTGQPVQPLLVALPQGERVTPQSAGSLFNGLGGASLFARPRVVALPAPAGTATGNTPAARLLNVIARAEAGPMGYDAVQYGARIKPPAPPTHLTLSEIDHWTRATPGQPHAIGRYQFIPATLRRLVRRAGLPPHTRFSPEVQDQLANILLHEAGLADFQDGLMERQRFMRNLAKIWAGLPLPDGRSYYQGYAGNKATMSWPAFDAAVEQAFAAQG